MTDRRSRHLTDRRFLGLEFEAGFYDNRSGRFFAIEKKDGNLYRLPFYDKRGQYHEIKKCAIKFRGGETYFTLGPHRYVTYQKALAVSMPFNRTIRTTNALTLNVSSDFSVMFDKNESEFNL